MAAVVACGVGILAASCSSPATTKAADNSGPPVGVGTTAAVVDAAPPTSESDSAADCEGYQLIVVAVAESSSDALDLTYQVYDALGTQDALVALLLDDELLNQLVSSMNAFSRDFATYQRTLPTAPRQWAETDRHLRLALSRYETAYSQMANAFTLFGNGQFDDATEIIANSASEITEATSEIEAATAAIPPGGC